MGRGQPGRRDGVRAEWCLHFAEGKIRGDSCSSGFQDRRQRLHRTKAGKGAPLLPVLSLNLCSQPVPTSGILTLRKSCPACLHPFVHKPFFLSV